MSLKVNKCTLYQPVYILGYKLFENEDQIFKVKNKQRDDTQGVFDQTQKKSDDQINPLKEFQDYLKNSNFEYIHQYVQQKRFEEGGCFKCNPKKKFKESSQFEESKQEIPSYSGQQGQGQTFKQSIDSQSSKLVSRHPDQEMNNFIFIFNEDEDVKLEDIQQSIKDHSEQKNIIQLSHFMNVNTFHTYKSFNTHFRYQIQDLEDFIYQENQNESTSQEENYKSIKNKRQFEESVKAIERALKDMKKIILFDSYKHSQDFHNNQTIDLVQSNFFDHTFYALAAEEIPEFDYISNHLHYYHKVSPYSVFSNIQQRLTKIVFNSVKDVIRLTLYDKVNDRKNEQKDLYRAICLDFSSKKDARAERIKQNWTKNECESIVYKNICSYGLLPVNVYLNDQNITKFKTKFVEGCVKLFSLNFPFPPKFHLNIQLMNKFYSYNTNSIFNCKDYDNRERILDQQFSYSKIRVIDFFPLDQWIEQLGSVLQDTILARIIRFLEKYSVRQDIMNLFESMKSNNNNEKIKLRSALNLQIKDILNDHIITQTIKDISYQFLKEYFFEVRLFQQWTSILAKTEDNFDMVQNNCHTGVSDFINHLTTICEDYYENGDGAYDYGIFLHTLKKSSTQDLQDKQCQFKELCERQFSLNINQPYANSKYNMPAFDPFNEEIPLEIEEKRLQEEQNNILFQKFKKFSSDVNNHYLDLVIEPILFELPIPKYFYFCETSHKKYIKLLQNGVPDIESLYKVVEEFQDDKQDPNFQKYTPLKEKILKNILEGNKSSKVEEFDYTHQVIKNLIKTAHQKRFQEKENLELERNPSTPPLILQKKGKSKDGRQLQRITSVLMNLYDSWYFQRKSRVNKADGITYQNQYEAKDILNELTYYYYNSVRLSSEILFINDNQFSIVGHLIIKNPSKIINSINSNSQK